MGGNAAAICTLHAAALARKIGADIRRACRSLLNVLDDLRDGTITLGDIGRTAGGTVGRAAILVAMGLAPVGVLAACNVLVISFLDPTPSPTRLWLALDGAAVALVASAFTMRWGQRVLFPDPSNSVHSRSWAD